MNAIRYYSKFGHSRMMAEAIEDIVGAKAATVAEPLSQPIDVLVLGAGAYMGRVGGAVDDFIDSLTPDKVGCVVLFGSCAIIESPVPRMRKALEKKGIKVCDKSFTCKGSMGPIHKGHPDNEDVEAFRSFVQAVVQR